MHKDIKDIIEYRESTSDCYREEGFKFFNDHILEFVSDESIPVLERINFANIVLSNYIEHFGRMQNMNLPWVHFKMINEFQKITGKINTAFSTIDTSILTHFHINMPKIYNEPEDEKDQEVLLVNQNCDIGYIKKNDTKNLVFDGIKCVPISRIRDFSIEYEIMEVGMWSEDYIENRVNEMYNTFTPEIILWINQNMPKDMKRTLREYILNNGYYPIFMNVDLLNCVNYDATEDESDLKYKPLTQKHYHYDYFNQKNFCDIFRLPYDSFDDIIDLYDQAIHNDKVTAIYLTIYRTKINKRLINTLIEGTHLGKKLNIYVEMTARGDEKNNLELVKKLQNECALENLNLYTSFSGYKVHAKMGLIALSDGSYICHCGTGNFNEVTANLYKDTHIITDDSRLIHDVIMSFKAIASKNPKNRIKLKKLIRNEIQKEIQQGPNGKIRLVCNHIADSEIIDLLGLAKQRGCDVKIFPRSTFGYSEREFGKKVFRGGRFLEHERIYMFGSGQTARIYLSSSDILFRNLYKRMEFTFKLPDYVDKSQFEKEYE